MSQAFGNTIRAARQKMGLTQKQVAEVLGVSRPAVGQWESGETEPSTANVFDLCDLLSIDIAAATSGLVRIRQIPSLDDDRTINILKDRRPGFRSEIEEAWRKENEEELSDRKRIVPVYDVSLMHGYMDFHRTDDIVDRVRNPPAISPKYAEQFVYALYTPNSKLSPRYEPGELIYLQKRHPIVPGDYVALHLASTLGGTDLGWAVRRLISRDASVVKVATLTPFEEYEIPADKVVEVHRIMNWGELIEF